MPLFEDIRPLRKILKGGPVRDFIGKKTGNNSRIRAEMVQRPYGMNELEWTKLIKEGDWARNAAKGWSKHLQIEGTKEGHELEERMAISYAVGAAQASQAVTIQLQKDANLSIQPIYKVRKDVEGRPLPPAELKKRQRRVTGIPEIPEREVKKPADIMRQPPLVKQRPEDLNITEYMALQKQLAKEKKIYQLFSDMAERGGAQWQYRNQLVVEAKNVRVDDADAVIETMILQNKLLIDRNKRITMPPGSLDEFKKDPDSFVKKQLSSVHVVPVKPATPEPVPFEQPVQPIPKKVKKTKKK